MSFITTLLEWYDKHARILPWRKTDSVYHIWLSEIILQQTRVAQGLDYYLRFIEHFPDVKSLANADEQNVMKLWQGLGYYSRARNLHSAAKTVVNELNSSFPDNYKDLKKLKGIGPYTAAAISSIINNEAVPAIDGNAFRVYSRIFNIEKDITQNSSFNYFFELGKDVMSKERPGDFNQAIMEIGATICLPKNPKCEICPVNLFCEAKKLGIQNSLPVKTKKVKIKQRFLHYFIIKNEDKILIKKRVEKDVWRNMFDFPLLETKNEFLEKKPFQLKKVKIIAEQFHILTHQKLKIKFYFSEVNSIDFQRIKKENNFIEIESLEKLNQFPLPRPIDKFVKENEINWD